MYIKDLTLFTLEEIYALKDSDFKSLELIKKLLMQEREIREKLGESEKINFIDSTIQTLVTLQSSTGIGHNLD